MVAITLPDAASTGSEDIRDVFIGWQCRIRQIAMRKDDGRPSSGMCPRVLTPDGKVLLEHLVTVLVPEAPLESTTFFKHLVRRTNDPREVIEAALTLFQATHFQRTTGFSDALTAVFAPGSELSGTLVRGGRCLLEFSQFSQSFRLMCGVSALDDEDDAYQATLWHNRLFNPSLPDGVKILAFQADWNNAQMGVAD